jgi:hypothetical protein
MGIDEVFQSSELISTSANNYNFHFGEKNSKERNLDNT